MVLGEMIKDITINLTEPICLCKGTSILPMVDTSIGDVKLILSCKTCQASISVTRPTVLIGYPRQDIPDTEIRPSKSRLDNLD